MGRRSSDFTDADAERGRVRLRRFRDEAGLTQLQLADRAGIDPKRIADWEQRPTSIGSKDLAKLAKALGRSMDDFYDVREPGPPAKAPPAPPIEVSVQPGRAAPDLIDEATFLFEAMKQSSEYNFDTGTRTDIAKRFKRAGIPPKDLYQVIADGLKAREDAAKGKAKK